MLTEKQLAILESIHGAGSVDDADALYAAIVIIDRQRQQLEVADEQMIMASARSQSWKNVAEQCQGTMVLLKAEIAALRTQLDGTRCYLCKVPHPNHAERCPER